MTQVGQVSRGLWTVAQRRGMGYFRYLVTGVVLPEAMYRLAWGPSAPAPLRGLFNISTRSRTRPATTDVLRDAGLVGGGTPTRAGTDEIEALMNCAHVAGITGISDAFGSIVRDAAGALRFTSLPSARRHRRRDAAFQAARDSDRRAFNEHFRESILTEAEARRVLSVSKSRVPQGYRDYAPIDFGGGLTIGQIASTDSGTGRWEFFNRYIVGPLVSGKRVLDLGSNNGSLPLMMLRAGAKEVVAVEYTPEIADFARLNARILAWRDIRPYEIDVLTGDMRIFLDRDLGEFDVVTAFCSLYYLPEQDMARIIRKAADMGATLILQANEVIDNLPAKAKQLESLMRANGYPEPTIHAPARFARPLLVGRSSTAPSAEGLSDVDLSALSVSYGN